MREKKRRYTVLVLGLFIFSLLVLASAIPGAEKKKQDDRRQAGENRKYKGEPGNFVFNNADLKNVLLFFARVYKLNIVIDPAISGKVTCRLLDVPWDQALDLILRQNGLALIKEGKAQTIQKLDKSKK
jgi:type IV pilus assembly protein PilQ